MTRDPDSQIETDISAFVNGQLDAERRYAVAAHLSAHPERAAEVMADLQMTEGLKLALGAVSPPLPPQMSAAATRLGRGLDNRHLLRRWLALAAAVVMFGFGWSAHTLLSRPAPAFLPADLTGLFDAALDAQDAVRVRLSLSDELGPMPRDAVEISERLGIALPDLPAGWAIRAAQVVSTPERPGLAIVIDTPDMGEIMLFGVLRSIDGPDNPPDAVARDGRTLAFFEKNRAAYVLVDNSGPVAALQRGAEELRRRFN